MGQQLGPPPCPYHPPSRIRLVPTSTPWRLDDAVQWSAIWVSAILGEANLSPAPGFLKKKALGAAGYHITRRTSNGATRQRGLLAEAKPCLEADPTRLGTTAHKPAASPCTPCSPRRSGCFLQVCGCLRDPCFLQAKASIAVRGQGEGFLLQWPIL